MTVNAQWFLDHYGTCKLEKCTCLLNGWRGTFCPDWQPLGVTTHEELLEYHRKNHEASKKKETEK